MAKRYISFKELQEHGLGEFKPYSTMGSHHGIVEEISEETIIIKGSAKGRVTIAPGWTLGYNCGQVWAIKPASLIKDPLLRVLRELKISKDALDFSEREVRVYCEHRICGAGYGPSGTTIRCLGNGWQRRYQGRPPEWYPGSGLPHPDEGEYWSGGEVAILTGHSCDRNFGQTRSRIERVVIRSQVTRERAADLIRAALIDEPAQARQAEVDEAEALKASIAKAEEEFNSFFQQAEEWQPIVIKFFAALLLRKQAQTCMYPYTMSSLPEELFPLPHRGVDKSILWTNGVIKVSLESYVFEKIAIQHFSVTEYRNSDPYSHLYMQWSVFQHGFSFPPVVLGNYEEKATQVRSLKSLETDVIEFVKHHLGW